MPHINYLPNDVVQGAPADALAPHVADVNILYDVPAWATRVVIIPYAFFEHEYGSETIIIWLRHRKHDVACMD